MPSGACARPLQLMFAARSRVTPVAAVPGGRPGQNEQPRTPNGVHPTSHHVAGSHQPADPDKAGRPRAPVRTVSRRGGAPMR